jgi:hypothetical protein
LMMMMMMMMMVHIRHFVTSNFLWSVTRTMWLRRASVIGQLSRWTEDRVGWPVVGVDSGHMTHGAEHAQVTWPAVRAGSGHMTRGSNRLRSHDPQFTSSGHLNCRVLLKGSELSQYTDVKTLNCTFLQSGNNRRATFTEGFHVLNLPEFMYRRNQYYGSVAQSTVKL